MKSVSHRALALGLSLLLLRGVLLAQSTVPPAKTLVSIHVKDASAESVANELTAASGIAVAPANPAQWAGTANVTLNADKQPFWVVMQDYMRQAGLTVQPIFSADRMRVVVAQAPPAKELPPQCLQGGLLFVADSISRTHTVMFNHPDQVMNGLSFRMRMFIDPQLMILGFSQIKVIEATDDKGNSLAQPSNFALRALPRTEIALAGLDQSVSLIHRPDAGKLLKWLKCEQLFQVVTTEDVWDIAEIANAAGSEKAFNGGRYTIMSLAPLAQQPSQTQYGLAIHVQYDTAVLGRGAQANPYIDPTTLRRSIHIFDGMGRELPSRGYSARGGPAGTRDLTMNFGLLGEANDPNSQPAKLQWRIPAEISDITVPIEFKDLPLP